MDTSNINVLKDSNIVLFLIQFFLLLGSSQLLGIFFRRINQPSVTADVLAGVIFGPSILGRFFPELHHLLFPADPLQITMLDTVAWIGILFLLLVAGLEVNFSSVWKHKGKAAWIAITGIVVPLLFSLTVLNFLPDRYLIDPERRFIFLLFLSTIMTISAMPVSIRIMQDFKMLRTDLGFLTVSALSMNDVIGWIVFTIILGVFIQGEADVQFVVGLTTAIFLFLFVAATFGKKVIGSMLYVISKRSTEASGHALSVVLLAGLLFGAITQKIGINALFGFFIAGLIAGESRDLPEKVRSTIDQIVNAAFIPIFFANIGLKIDLFESFDVILITVFIVLGIVARFLGSFAGAKLARIPEAQRLAVSALHTPGGEMHIVIATLAFELHLINETVFVAIIVSAIVSTITLGPMLGIILKRSIPHWTIQIPSNAAFEITSESKPEVIYSLSTHAAHILNVSPDSIYTKAKYREDGMSTAIEQCIAIPHARLPGINRSVIIFGRSETGVEWDSPDGLPTRIIFLIVTPDDQTDTQLQIYRQLVRVLFKNEYHDPIVFAPTVNESVGILNAGLRLYAITG